MVDEVTLDGGVEALDGVAKDDMRSDGVGYPATGTRVWDQEKAEWQTKHVPLVEESVGLDTQNIVDWDGPDDPENPMNWSMERKVLILGLVSVATFVTPLAASMFAPGVPQLMEDFHNTSNSLSSFVISVYILAFGLGPLVIAPLSETLGRQPCYHTANILFVIFSLACGFSTNLGMFTFFRFLQGCAGVTPVTIGAGTIADLIAHEHRGTAISLWAMGPLIGPVVGPIMGGFVSQDLNWRWVFYVLSMAAGVIALSSFFILSETHAPVLLARKAARLRKETGNEALRSKLDKGLTARQAWKRAIVRPIKLLTRSPIVLIISLDMAVVYAYLYLFYSTLTYVFQASYGFSEAAAGLTFIGVGVGSLLGLGIIGMTSDKYVKSRTKAAGGVKKPEYRLPLLIPGAFAVPIGLLWYGWTVHFHCHWMVPIIGSALVGFGQLSTSLPCQTYLIDSYTVYAASASAGANLLRSLFGATLPLAGRSLFDTLGYGWGNTLLAFISLFMIPVPFFLVRYGERIRTDPRFQPVL